MIRILNSLGARLTGRDDFFDQYRRYRETVRWIVQELFRFDSKKTLSAIVSNILGGILKAGALAFLLYYASLMEKSVDITLLGSSWHSRSEPVFYFFISLAVALLVFGSLCIYWGSHVINTLTIEFASDRSQRVMASSGGRPQKNPDPQVSNFPLRVKGSVAGIIGFTRAVKPILQVSNPLTTLCYSLVVLFYLDTRLSLVIMLLVLPSLVLQYLVNYHSAQNEKGFLRSRPRSQRKLNRLLEKYALVPHLYPSRREWLTREYTDSAIGENLQGYYRRIMAQPRSALVSDILLAALSLLVIGYLGSRALTGDIGWAPFVGYLLFARITLMALRGVLMAITGFARHYPLARRAFEYARSQNVSISRDAISLKVESRDDDMIGDRKTLTIKSGMPVMLFSSVPLSRFNLYAFIDVLAGGDISSRNRLCAEAQCISNGLSGPPGGTLNELSGVSAQASDQVFTAELQAKRLDGVADPLWRNKLIPDEVWKQYPRHLRACLLLEQSSQNPAPLTLVDAAVLNASRTRCADRWLKANNDSKVVVVTDKFPHLMRYEGEYVVFMAPDRAVSIASKGWCEANEAGIYDWFERHSVIDETVADDEELYID